jgi:hypothetical protein
MELIFWLLLNPILKPISVLVNHEIGHDLSVIRRDSTLIEGKFSGMKDGKPFGILVAYGGGGRNLVIE